MDPDPVRSAQAWGSKQDKRPHKFLVRARTEAVPFRTGRGISGNPLFRGKKKSLSGSWVAAPDFEYSHFFFLPRPLFPHPLFKVVGPTIGALRQRLYTCTADHVSIEDRRPRQRRHRRISVVDRRIAPGDGEDASAGDSWLPGHAACRCGR